MKKIRIISTILAVLMLMGAFTFASAAEEEVVGHISEPETGWKTNNTKPTIDYFTGQGVKKETTLVDGVEKETGKYIADGEKIVFNAEDKLRYMDKRFVKDGYELYVDAYSGEVATKCLKTGEILFSNPYSIGNYDSTKMSDDVKKEVMSQIVVKYTDIATEEYEYYYSYEWAASRGQIIVRNVKNGIRVEYTIGREEARLLVPHMIAKDSFEKKILNIMGEAVGYDFTTKKATEGANSEDVFSARKVMAYYKLKDPENEQIEEVKQNILTQFPITKRMPVYVLDDATSETEKAKIETLIKTYCPDYSYEDLDEDHLLVGYTAEDKNPPLFKMALEYSLDTDGMTVRLPANGIRFNESLYRLDEIQILPYMGAGANPNEGYTFFPDGSGTLFDFNKIAESGIETSLDGTLYGNDYAYHTISGKLEEILRYPVFGIVENENITAFEPEPEGTTEGVVEEEKEDVYKKRGYVAMVEEGDALMQLSSYHMGAKGVYNTVMMTVFPRPKDTYNVADAISVGANDTWTVVSARKYTGNFKIRYFMLTDPAVANASGITNYYDTSYAGMAQAYRDYLEKTGVLTKLTDEQVDEDVPLYIETFGAIFSTQKFLSVPVDVTVPLTSFDDIVTMYDELSVQGVDNINFIMKGYTKGGLESEKVPYRLKWEKAVKGDYDFEELLAYSNEKGFELFPDFDFVFFSNNTLFDGLTLKKHAVKTIDNRYTSKRDYSATKQSHVGYYDLAISPAYFSRFYEKFTENYLKTGATSISVSTLGSFLNSDFDEDEPYNREDAKAFTIQAFEYLNSKYENVMTEGGNAYTWKYVDYITDIALDSSRYAQSSASVPFLGMVLHGYVQYAGSAINMEGNIEYAMLKAIENGAGLKFILSYQNTDELKKYEITSNYYSIRYDIWLEDVVELYNELNSVLAGVQTSVIAHHEFLNDGIRVPDDDEILRDVENAVNAAINNERDNDDKKNQELIDALREAREQTKNTAAVFGNGGVVGEGDNELSMTKYASTKTNFDSIVASILATTTLKEATALVSSFENDANRYAFVGAGLCNLYQKANTTYRELILADDTLSQARKDALIASLDAMDANIVCTGNNLDTFKAEFELQVKSVYDKFVALGMADVTLEGMLDKIYTAAGIKVVEQEPEEEFDSKVNTYKADDNKIVYEVYQNGNETVELLLNFNNYRVMVAVNGVLYTVDAYGYIVLPKAN
ncbi:MAG: hypothetical protein E7653_05535 [Ruminococcaceae bacterium]|nr:hypothetical protein [Oscillospiraceae bacterium]